MKKAKAKKHTKISINTICIFTIIIFTFILYGNTIYNNYSLDDHDVTFNNTVVSKGIKGIPEIFTSLYSIEENLSYGYRPLVKTTFAIEHQFFGQNPHISHLINILLYLLTILLLFKILSKLFNKHSKLFPLIITLLFMAHPIHTEVVASLKNRDEILSFLNCLIALHFLIKYIDFKKIKYLILNLFFFLLAIFSKETALPFIFVFPLVIYFFSETKTKKVIYLSLLFLTIGLLATFLPKLYLPQANRPILFYENPLLFEKNIWVNIGTAFYILIFYVKLLIFPHPLVYYYGYNTIPLVNLANIYVIISILFYLAIFVYSIIKIKEKHILSFAILYFLITIVMYSNIIIKAPGIVGERFLFAPSLGFAIVIAYFIFKLFNINTENKNIKIKTALKPLLLTIIILIPYTAKTFTRNKNWRTHLSLYSNDIKYNSNSVKANLLYASVLTHELNIDNEYGIDISKIPEKQKLIINSYEKALELWPENYEAENNLGSFYSNNLKDYNSAIQHFKKAIELNPDIDEPYFNLGYAYENLNKYEKAIEAYKKAIKVNPENINVRSFLANLYNKIGDFDNAVKINTEIAKIDSTSDLPYINIGNYYLLRKDTATAISYWEKAVEKIPQYNLCINLSRHYRNLGNEKKANYYYQKAIKSKIKKK